MLQLALHSVTDNQSLARAICLWQGWAITCIGATSSVRLHNPAPLTAPDWGFATNKISLKHSARTPKSDFAHSPEAVAFRALLFWDFMRRGDKFEPRHRNLAKTDEQVRSRMLRNCCGAIVGVAAALALEISSDPLTPEWTTTAAVRRRGFSRLKAAHIMSALCCSTGSPHALRSSIRTRDRVRHFPPDGVLSVLLTPHVFLILSNSNCPGYEPPAFQYVM